MKRLLLDTHAFLWWQSKSVHFPARLREIVLDEEHEVYVSAVSAWEIVTKFQLGKLAIEASLAKDVEGAARASGLSLLPVSFAHVQRTGLLPTIHKDPFDRLLIAQALVEQMTLVSNEKLFDSYGVDRLW